MCTFEGSIVSSSKDKQQIIGRMPYAVWRVGGFIFLFCDLQVASPYISGLIGHLETRFQNLDVIAAFSVLGPQGAALGDEENISHLQILARKFLHGEETLVNQEWRSFKEHLLEEHSRWVNDTEVSPQPGHCQHESFFCSRIKRCDSLNPKFNAITMLNMLTCSYCN